MGLGNTDVGGSLGLVSAIPRVIRDFYNYTGGTITRGYVGVVDQDGVSTPAPTVGSNLESPDSRWTRMIAHTQGPLGSISEYVRANWYGVLMEESLPNGQIGRWLLQGYVEKVQCFVTATDATASSLTTADPYRIYSLDVASGGAGRLALRAPQAGAAQANDTQRRGCFAAETFIAADTAMLLPGLFLGGPSDHFGFLHV